MWIRFDKDFTPDHSARQIEIGLRDFVEIVRDQTEEDLIDDYDMSNIELKDKTLYLEELQIREYLIDETTIFAIVDMSYDIPLRRVYIWEEE